MRPKIDLYAAWDALLTVVLVVGIAVLVYELVAEFSKDKNP